MSKERKINVAKALAAQLRATEESIDTALCEAAHLIETYINSRRAIHISTVVANDVHLNTLEAMRALNAAQTWMTAAHSGLSHLQTQIGLGDTAVVPGDDKPGTTSPGNTSPSGRLMPEPA
ncbi:hypothetical protein [Asticcacaulis sp. EMRT-3]|uniref:hypothetical protein n=1 Tax=Asticcacaulis sp. EMRT-3 TaxID=3040349 RepID=UPI0024AE8EA9|nr:hypothetical protein [Asticcacaulis sp. EMRT-3]MDI7774437.1 hypothetical protein [Asticcacaulis sp. EMRT-3]